MHLLFLGVNFDHLITKSVMLTKIFELLFFRLTLGMMRTEEIIRQREPVNFVKTILGDAGFDFFEIHMVVISSPNSVIRLHPVQPFVEGGPTGDSG